MSKPHQLMGIDIISEEESDKSYYDFSDSSIEIRDDGLEMTR